ncbi:MAG TPA: hypothetical protein ENH24_00570 [Nitrospirae bacterium]|nr:hypothetical protein BMS3Bbin08_00066 [bacterium BMS3Bbin08]HDH52963.1 hypothetical protein [Nitrospirota bacterium]
MEKKRVKKEAVHKKSAARKPPIKGTLSRHGVNITFKISLTPTEWEYFNLLYFEDDGKSAQQFYEDFYSSFIVQANSTFSKGVKGKHTDNLFRRAMKIQSAILCNYFRKNKKQLESDRRLLSIPKDEKNPLGFTVYIMKIVYREWIKEYQAEQMFNDEDNIERTYIQDGRNMLKKENTSTEKDFIRSMLTHEREKNVAYYLANKPIFDFIYELTFSPQ